MARSSLLVRQGEADELKAAQQVPEEVLGKALRQLGWDCFGLGELGDWQLGQYTDSTYFGSG